MAEGPFLPYLEVAMATATWMTVEELAALPDDGQKHELVEGELVTMPPPHTIHSRIVARLFRTRANFVVENDLGEVLAEAGFRLAEDPPTVRQSDVSFVSTAKVESQPEDGPYRGAPDVAIEVLSPSDKAEDVRLKVRQYLATGASAVALVYPRTREIEIHRAGTPAETLEVGQSLAFPDWPPDGRSSSPRSSRPAQGSGSTCRPVRGLSRSSIPRRARSGCIARRALPRC